MENNINVLTSIKTNYLSWIVIILSIITVSYPHIKAGFITFIVIFLHSYFMHKYIHIYRNIITIVHHYHHENNNLLSHIAEIMFELVFSIAIIPYYYFLGDEYINIWSAFLFYLFYVTVHNINYGIMRVNNVHYLHHKDMNTNHGPDICDIAFGTKNIENTEVEDTTHYIPNFIFLTLFILIIKYLCQEDNIRSILTNLLYVILIIIFLFLTITSIYLTLYYNKPSNNSKNDMCNEDIETEGTTKTEGIVKTEDTVKTKKVKSMDNQKFR